LNCWQKKKTKKQKGGIRMIVTAVIVFTIIMFAALILAELIEFR